MPFVDSLIARQITSTTTPNYDTAAAGIKFICGAVVCDAGGAMATVADSQSNAYNYGATFGGASPPFHRHRIFHLNDPLVGNAHNFTVSGNNVAMVVALFSDRMRLSYTDVEAGAGSGGVSQFQGGVVTPSEALSLIFTSCGWSQNQDPFVEAAFTETLQADGFSGVNYGVTCAFRILTQSAAFNPIWTGVSFEGVTVINGAFKRQPPVVQTAAGYRRRVL